MPKQNSGGWSKRTRKGNITTTYNSKNGMTYSSSQKVGLTTITNTILPNGKARKMVTTRTPNGYVRRQTYTYGKKSRRKKITGVGLFVALMYIIAFVYATMMDK